MIRVQRRRGVPLPPGAKYVGRPTRWGNPYRIGEVVTFEPSGVELTIDRKVAVGFYAATVLPFNLRRDPGWLDPLRDATALACWCPLDQPCHADVLIEALEAQA